MSEFINTLIERNKRFININEYKKRYASDAPKESFTFRINPMSKLVVDKNAELLDISTGQFINILIDEFVSLIEKSQNSDNLILINNKRLIERITQILNNHGLSGVKSFEFLSNFGIEINDLLNEYELSKKLNSKTLKELCCVFNVSLEWLFGFSDYIYSIQKINGDVSFFLDCLLKEVVNENNKNVVHVVIDPKNNKASIIYEVNKMTGEVEHKKYIFFEVSDWKLDASRILFKQCMRICVEMANNDLIKTNQLILNDEFFNQICQGKIFITSEILESDSNWTENYGAGIEHIVTNNENNPELDEWMMIETECLDKTLIEKIRLLGGANA